MTLLGKPGFRRDGISEVLAPQHVSSEDWRKCVATVEGDRLNLPDLRWPAVTEVLRYAKGADRSIPELDGLTNFHFLTRDPDRLSGPRLLLESGINRVAMVSGSGGPRRPLLLLRSSPWKAGDATNPWHDVFALDYGHVRYFGDHKVSTIGPVGVTAGNAALLEAWDLHASPSAEERLGAPPLLLFRAIPQFINGSRVDKGFVEFCGVAILERLEHVVQRDSSTGRTFPNIAADLCVVDLTDLGDRLDFRWLDDRRNPDVPDEACLEHAPAAWVRWVKEGRSALPVIRRRVLSSRVLSRVDQLPDQGGIESRTLDAIYHKFDENKHAFESLAAKVAGRVLGGPATRYHEGWITKSGGDGGLDFVGRLDIGQGASTTPVVVLGQAKCVAPSSAISADQVARVVARLKRGWIGVYVTTGTFSRMAQVEIVDDQYPVVLIHARTLVAEVIKIATESYAGDLDRFLDSILDEHSMQVAHRRPEEVLMA